MYKKFFAERVYINRSEGEMPVFCTVQLLSSLLNSETH